MSMKSDGVTRRDFIRNAALGSAAVGAASLLGSGRVHAAGSGKIRIGLIGCGGRGLGAGIMDCAKASPDIELVAIGDLFKDKVEAASGIIKERLERAKLPVKEIFKVTPETMFSGWDAYLKVINAGVDMVILTTPPYFRPMHFKAAVEAGKHVFVEKPIAVDPVGVRSFIETAEKAKEKKLTVVAGTQMRRARHIMAAMDLLHNGGVGDILSGQCIRCSDGMTEWYAESKEKKAEWSEMEWQIRRWLFMTWLSGDFVVEMHVHNLDLINWAMQSPPSQCMIIGGRQVRTGPEFGDVYDHFAGELEYPNGARVEYIGSQIDKGPARMEMRFVGSKGNGFVDFARSEIKGEKPWTYEGESVEPHVQEYKDMLDSIRNGTGINEGRQVAESTLTAIMIRMSAYTGRALKWDWVMNSSKLDLSPEKLELGPHPLGPIPMPGVTPLV
jgi:predicted dehydrogenase